MIVPLPFSAILGLPLHLVLPALPDLAELLAGLGETPANGRLLTPDDGRDLRGGKPFQVAKHQDRAVRDRHLGQDELDFLGQLGLDSGVRIGELERQPAFAVGPIDGCGRAGSLRLRRSWSRPRLTPTRNSQGPNRLAVSKRSSRLYTRQKVSWARSRASSGSRTRRASTRINFRS